MSGGMASIGGWLGVNPGAAGTGAGGLGGVLGSKSPDPYDPKFNPDGVFDQQAYSAATRKSTIDQSRRDMAMQMLGESTKPKPFTGHKKTPGGKFVAQPFDAGPMVPTQEDPAIAGPETSTRERLMSKRQKKKKMHSAGGLLA